MNSLIRNGRLTIDFRSPTGSDIAVDATLIEDALGYVPADEATEIPTANGVIGGGTLGAPEVIRTDDTVVRTQTQGDGTNVILLRNGVPPASNPSGGVFLYVDQADNTMKTRDMAGAIDVP